MRRRAAERRTGERARKRVTRSLRSSNGKRRVGKMIERRVGRIHPSRDGAREANEGRAREAGMRYINRYRPVSYRHHRHHRHQCHQRHHRHHQQSEVAFACFSNRCCSRQKCCHQIDKGWWLDQTAQLSRQSTTEVIRAEPEAFHQNRVGNRNRCVCLESDVDRPADQ